MKHFAQFKPIPCPICGVFGWFTGAYITTDMGYEEPHDPNSMCGEARCSAGHSFFGWTGVECSCGWSSDKDPGGRPLDPPPRIEVRTLPTGPCAVPADSSKILRCEPEWHQP
jgi:hypothetical protein